MIEFHSIWAKNSCSTFKINKTKHCKNNYKNVIRITRSKNCVWFCFVSVRSERMQPARERDRKKERDLVVFCRISGKDACTKVYMTVHGMHIAHTCTVHIYTLYIIYRVHYCIHFSWANVPINVLCIIWSTEWAWNNNKKKRAEQTNNSLD